MLRLTTLVITLLAASCSFSKGPTLAKLAPVANATLQVGEDVIEPGDLLQVRVISDNAPAGPAGVVADPAFQLNQDVRVQADGRASFIGLDDLPVAGLLPSVLDEILTGRYASLLDEEPILSVVIVQQAPRTVTVFGEVLVPGVIPIPPDGHLSLEDALGRAGGPSTQTAWLSNTLLVRWDPKEREQLSWKVDARRRHWGAPETVYLQNRDVIFVPNTNVDYIAIGLDNFVRRMIPLPNIFAPIQ